MNPKEVQDVIVSLTIVAYLLLFLTYMLWVQLEKQKRICDNCLACKQHAVIKRGQK